MRNLGCLALVAVWGVAGLHADMVMDGAARDVLYGAPLAVQDTDTGFGNAALGRPDVANGSEIDGLYAAVYDGTLYLVIAGNLETNGNKLELFFDTRAGGQNRLLATNPGFPNAGVRRMADDGSGNGLTFKDGFEADFWVSVAALGNPVSIYVDYAELYVDANNPGVAYYVGAGQAVCETDNGNLAPGDEGAPAIRATLDNRNRGGVAGGPGVTSASFEDIAAVKTGVELAIPLSALGNPTGPIQVVIFINGQQHDYMSNQMLGGYFGLAPNPDGNGNPGEPRNVNLNDAFFHLPVTVALDTVVVGACCLGTQCQLMTAADCAAATGTYLGDNASCAGNPCAGTAGSCCIDDGFAGECHITTESECVTLGGTFELGGNCSDCACVLPPSGACCTGEGCVLLREADCLLASGTYAGDNTNCGSNPCDFGACCIANACQEVLRFECTAQSGTWVGGACAAVDCSLRFENPHFAGEANGWNNMSHPLTETAVGSKVYTITFSGLNPNSRQQFKITNGMNWDGAWPLSNAWGYADGEGNFTVIFDQNLTLDGLLPNKDRTQVSVVPLGATAWTAVGSWQGWNNANPNTVMASLGGGVYQYVGTGLNPGTYMWKIVNTGSWDAIGSDGRGVDARNFEFTILDATDTFTMTADVIKGAMKIEITAAPTEQYCPGDMNCDTLVNFADISLFIAAIKAGSPDNWTYDPDNGVCAYLNGDTNGDNAVNFGDISGFIAQIKASPDPCVTIP